MELSSFLLFICLPARVGRDYFLIMLMPIKSQVLRIVLDSPIPSFGAPEPLLHRIMKYLVLATSTRAKDNDQNDRSSSASSYTSLIILRLLVTWLADFSDAVHCLLDSSVHLTYLLELLSGPHPAFVRGLASVILGECVIYNKRPGQGINDAFAVVDSISQKMGLASFFRNLEELQKNFNLVSTSSVQHRKPLTRSMVASMADVEEIEDDGGDKKLEHPILPAIFDVQFVDLVKKLEVSIREGIVEIYGQPKSKVAVVPAELEQKSGESDGDYIKRLRSFVEKQCIEMQVSSR